MIHSSEGPATGCLSSYALNLMLLHFLARQGVIPPPSTPSSQDPGPGFAEDFYGRKYAQIFLSRERVQESNRDEEGKDELSGM